MDPAQLSLWVMMLWLPWGPWPWYLSWSMVSSCLTVLLIYFQCCQSLGHLTRAVRNHRGHFRKEISSQGPL